MYTYIDDESNKVLQVDTTKQSFWDKGQFPKTSSNPWINQPNVAPFNTEFYIVMNVAVGGVADYFPDNIGNKPWSNKSSQSVNEFYNAKSQWFTTWKGDDVAMVIESVKVWSVDATSMKE